eukprot:CAMPEP_0181116068 /NCGR_PEP_ID=MMETSP1071-20121207/21756_1 /TAXON_ID=35127 /ORGANISM="Thalassiosira sp., Strain NH16" /LENGTH=125 /DNA_ID=CAMNT_0023200293 /DNA_START=35 /DNA_END=412 /DNA_ORIENTATION=+
MSEETYQHGDGCCECKCTDGPIGVGGCMLMTFCPCIAFKVMADKVDESGCLHCMTTLCGCGCCSLIVLGQKVEEKRNIKKHDLGWHVFYSWCNLCSQQTCRVMNECSVYEKEGAVSAPAAAAIER